MRLVRKVRKVPRVSLVVTPVRPARQAALRDRQVQPALLGQLAPPALLERWALWVRREKLVQLGQLVRPARPV